MKLSIKWINYTERFLIKYGKYYLVSKFEVLDQIYDSQCKKIDLELEIEILHNELSISTFSIKKKSW